MHTEDSPRPFHFAEAISSWRCPPEATISYEGDPSEDPCAAIVLKVFSRGVAADTPPRSKQRERERERERETEKKKRP